MEMRGDGLELGVLTTDNRRDHVLDGGEAGQVKFYPVIDRPRTC